MSDLLEGYAEFVPALPDLPGLAELVDMAALTAADPFAFNPNQPRDARGRWIKGGGVGLPNADVIPTRRRSAVSRLVKPSRTGRGKGPTSYTVGGRKRDWTPDEARKVADALEASADGKSVPAAVEGKTVSTQGGRRVHGRVHAFPTRDGNVILDVGADSGKDGTGEQELTPEEARDLAALLRKNADRDEGDSSKESAAPSVPKRGAGRARKSATEAGPSGASDWLSDASGGKLSPKSEKAIRDTFAFDDPDTGMKSEVSSLTATPDGIEIVVDVRDADGRLVGKAVRTLEPPAPGQKPQMYHNSLFLGKQAQGGGFSSRWIRQAEEQYRKVGIGSIGLTTNDIGSYAWAKAGFKFADGDQAKKIAERFEKAMAKAPKDVADAGAKLIKRARSKKAADWPTPMEFAMLGWKPGETSWFGKDAIIGTAWKGVKEL